MLSVAAKYFSKASELKKLLFALVHLPDDLPERWAIALDFATGKDGRTITTEQVRVLSENLHELDKEAFETDETLTRALLQCPSEKPLGIVLLSERSTCPECKSNLLLRRDRPAAVAVYHDVMGSVPGTHFHRYCSNRKCSYTQYYGYHTVSTADGSHKSVFDDDWEELPYFVSSRETAFQNKLIERFHSQILLGQQSFVQCADVYNHLHAVQQSHQCDHLMM